MSLKIRVHERLNESFSPKTVRIGNQVWMAENLTIDDGGEGIFHHNGKTYYTWDAAVRIAKTLKGWHLPRKEEWYTLFTAVGGKDIAGKVLKSKTGWKGNGNGTDSFGFSALPAGNIVYDGYFNCYGCFAYFWSSTEDDNYNADSVYLYYEDDNANLDVDYKSYGFSVRLIKG